MATNSPIPNVTLNTGAEMPILGFGVWKSEVGSETEQAVMTALEAGYRSIDTAMIYRNEESVGQAIASSELPREDLFITTKLWNDDQTDALSAFEASLERLGLDYVDLYLVHWPISHDQIPETWRQMETIQSDGRARAIGVSNFKPHHLDTLLESAKITPAVNQVELHPRLNQADLRAYCASKGIQVEAWSPLYHGGELLDDPTIAEIAKDVAKTPAQVILRWHLQHGIVAIPKSVTPERIHENAQLFDFELTDAQMTAIDNLNQDDRTGADPDEFPG